MIQASSPATPRVSNAAADLIDRNVTRGLGDKLAYTDGEHQLTYRQLQADSCRLGRLLGELGLRREDRVAMIMLDTVEWPVVFLGAIRAGIVPIPLNTLLAAEQYAYMLSDSRAKVLFATAALLPVVREALALLDNPPPVVVVRGAPPAGMKAFSELLDRQDDSLFLTDTHPDEPAFWLYSSGSTGAPKGTKHIHTSLMATAATYGAQVLGIRQDDICHSAAKLFFAYGLGNALTFPLSVGATVVLNPARPTPAAVFEILKTYKPTLYFGVPTLYAAMLGDPTMACEPGSPDWRLCVSAGEALPAHVGESWKARFGVDILDGVGSTEMLHIFLSNAPGDIIYGTSGHPVPGYDVSLRGETGAEVSGEDVGELYVRGPSAAEGYWNQRDKSRSTFQGEWTRTGDKYTRDPAGRFTYCGRADDMFKVSGIWVSPFEIEAALITHPAVLEAAAVPAEDTEGLLKPKAFVVLKEGFSADGLTEALKEHVKASVGMWKYPRWIEFTETLPKTATGKIQRFKLRGDG